MSLKYYNFIHLTYNILTKLAKETFETIASEFSRTKIGKNKKEKKYFE